MKMDKNEIEKQIVILEKSIREMLSFDKRLISFSSSKAKDYNNQIKKLFTQLTYNKHIRIESCDLNKYCEEGLDKIVPYDPQLKT